jgi:hypothetical protein
MACRSLKYLNELVIIEEKEKKKHEKETRQEAQLPVSASEALAPTNTPVYSLVDLSNPFENLDFVVLFANYDPLDLFWSDQDISFSILQTS